MVKTYLRAAVLAVTLMVVAGSGQASEDAWRIAIQADDGSSMYYGAYSMFGVYGQSSDGVDTMVQTQDAEELLYFADVSRSLRWVVGCIPGDSRTWGRDIASPTGPSAYPDAIKRWYIRVAAAPDAVGASIRLRFLTLSSTLLPTSTVCGRSVGYRLVLTDNKGRAGAPASRTYWDLPIPTVHKSTSVPYYSIPQLLPIIKLTSYDHTAMINEGYQLEFQQYFVPEPGSICVLLAGLSGLAVLAIVRRRSLSV